MTDHALVPGVEKILIVGKPGEVWGARSLVHGDESCGFGDLPITALARHLVNSTINTDESGALAAATRLMAAAELCTEAAEALTARVDEILKAAEYLGITEEEGYTLADLQQKRKKKEVGGMEDDGHDEKHHFQREIT